MSDEKAVTKAAAGFGERGIEIKDLRDAYQFAEYVASSGLAPRGMDTPTQILVAVQTGMEAGLKPMSALRSIYVVNGAPAWRGDAGLGLVRASGVLGTYEKRYEGTPMEDDWTCIVTLGRKGEPSMEFDFSLAEAKHAKLFPPSSPQSPWSKYPKRMLYYRALGMGLRELFSDVLGSMHLAEELQDEPTYREAMKDVTPAEKPAADDLFDGLTGAAQEPEVLPPEGASSQDSGVSPENPPPAVQPLDPEEVKAHQREDFGVDQDGQTVAEEALGPQTPSRPTGPEADMRDDEAVVPAVKLTQKPRKTNKSLNEALEAIEHPMPREVTDAWDTEQKRAAWDWAWELRWLHELRAAGHPDGDEPNPIPRPSFIPEYGGPPPVASPHTDDPQKDPPSQSTEEGDCGRVLDLEGTACGLKALHQGPCEPR